MPALDFVLRSGEVVIWKPTEDHPSDLALCLDLGVPGRHLDPDKMDNNKNRLTATDSMLDLRTDPCTPKLPHPDHSGSATMLQLDSDVLCVTTEQDREFTDGDKLTIIHLVDGSKSTEARGLVKEHGIYKELTELRDGFCPIITNSFFVRKALHSFVS
ncbi:hypothetical protein RvY_09953 [Ramazzottius varieornatus]|uniref:Uncharacterized protein n=1 Tax=Ramazzottius varieornatus TaxID=947166 RepID=A0A1D1VB59_RAMVA|nr:hypothetical protein RvY_09953 [Ramazzottius varieornatus]